MRAVHKAIAFATATAIVGCGGDPRPTDVGSSGGADAGGGTSFTGGEELRVPVPEERRVFVKLASPPEVVTPSEPMTDTSWDLAFEGYEVFTNSGPSGGGQASAFGPLDTIVFLDDRAPEVPFLSGDKASGAFVRWYYYAGPPNHALHSRFHVFGVRDGDRQYKVQIIDYYGERDGDTVSALYRLRWAEVTASGPGEVTEASGLDGTAGGTQGDADAPGECLDLGTGARTMLAPSAARASSAWHLCFHRQDIRVNGEEGGPRGVGAVDFHADEVATERLSEVAGRDERSEQVRFDAVDAETFAGHTFRGDRVVSAFGDLWLERGSSPPEPRRSAWLVVGADGANKHLVGFAAFEGATSATPGTIVMRVKSVR
jgi:hypothetical protein